jgi:8-oxo-dGTP diphosphatase
MLPDDIRFCPRCGEAVAEAFLFGKNRKTCPGCEWVHFQDPKVAAAALVLIGGRILLVQRDNPPQRGLWSLPAGFVDAGEDPARAVERECLEEAGIQVEAEELLELLSGQEHSRGADILLVYRARVVGGELHPGDDARDARFFPHSELPDLAFSSTKKILARYIGSPSQENK